MSDQLSLGQFPLSYLGVGTIPTQPTPLFVSKFVPTSKNTNFQLGTHWLVQNKNIPQNKNLYALVSLTGNNTSTLIAVWVLIATGTGSVIGLHADDGNNAFPLNGLINIHNTDGFINITAATPNTVTLNLSGGVVVDLTGNSGGAVAPLGGNINVVGDGTTITIAGNPATHTLTASAVGTGLVQTLTGDVGGAVPPTAGNINILGTANKITVTGNPGTSTLTLNTGANVATTYNEDVGSATPAAGVLTVAGGTNISTSGAGSTVTINLNTATTPWTPVLKFGGSSTGITYSLQQGFYTQIGHTVSFSLAIVLTNKGAQVGTATITGLGFSAALAVGLQGTCSNLTFANQLAFGTDGSTITFNNLVSGGAETQLDNTAFANNTVLNISGIFQV